MIEYIQIYLVGYLIFGPTLYALRFIDEKFTLSDGAIIGWPFMWPILAPIFLISLPPVAVGLAGMVLIAPADIAPIIYAIPPKIRQVLAATLTH